MNSLEQPMAEMSVSKQTITSPALDWSPKKLTHESLVYQKINVINGVNSATISNNSTQGAFSFQIPAKVMSLKESFIALDLALTYPSGTAVLDGNLGNIFSRVVISTDSGVVLADINDFHRYSSMLVPASTKYDDVCDGTFSGFDTFETTSLAIARTAPLSNIQKSNNSNLNGGYIYDGAVPPVASLSPAVNRFRSEVTATHNIDTNAGSLRHLFMSETITTAGYASYQFRLKDLLPYTIASMDQLLFFGGQQIQIDLYLNGIDYIGYKGATPALAGSIASLTSIAMTNLSFFLAVESNVKTIDAVIQKVKTEGVKLRFPYVYGSKTSISASTSQSVNQVITRTSGARLLWVAYSPYLTTSTVDLVNSHNAIAIDNYTTTLDNVNIKSQSPIDVDRGELWIYNRSILKGSCVRGVNDLSNDFVDFTSYIGRPICDFDVSVEDGLPLNENHTWGVNAVTTSTALTHHIYYCMSRELVLQNFSVQVI